METNVKAIELKDLWRRYKGDGDEQARERLVASYDHDVTTPEWATGYRWDIVLTGGRRTPMEDDDR